MTVINNIEIDDIQYNRNPMKEAIANNKPLEKKLHVVLTISNPCLYARRYILIKEFIQRMELEESNVLLYVVEMVYGKQRFIVTDTKNPRHLQLRATTAPIWHKENMTNLGIERLLPKSWKAVAWIDSDIEFEDGAWAMNTLKILNGTKDIVQLFSHAVDMSADEQAMNIFTGFGYQYSKGNPYSKRLVNFWHPGYAWACTRAAYKKMGRLYENAILGSGDNIMSLSLIQKGLHALNDQSTDGYKRSVLDYQERVKTLRLGYVPGVIRHYYHGSKKDRQYGTRWEILVRHEYDPNVHVCRDPKTGILAPTDACPKELVDEILRYFQTRNEDSCYLDNTSLGKKGNVIMPSMVKMMAQLSSEIEEEKVTEEEQESLENTMIPLK